MPMDEAGRSQAKRAPTTESMTSASKGFCSASPIRLSSPFAVSVSRKIALRSGRSTFVQSPNPSLLSSMVLALDEFETRDWTRDWIWDTHTTCTHFSTVQVGGSIGVKQFPLIEF
jgi:hypothetical protein